MLGRPAGALWRIRLAGEFHVVRISSISDNVTAGYSGTPLAKKLGIVADTSVAAIEEPASFRGDLAPVPSGVTFR